MKKRIAILLCFVLVFSLCLCACSNEKDALMGSWKGTMDMAEMVNAGMAESDPDAAEFMKLDTFNMTFIMTFNEDDTYSLVVDEDALKAEIDAVADQMVQGVLDYMVAMLAEEGMEMTAEEIIAMSGVSLDDLKTEMMANMDLSELATEINTYGKFDVSKGKLFTSDSVDAEADKLVYELYSIEGNTLTIDKGNGADADDDLVYPMTFQKVG